MHTHARLSFRPARARLAAALPALLLLASCDGGRGAVFQADPRMLAPVVLDDAVAYVSGAFERGYVVAWDAAAAAPAVRGFRTGRDPVGVYASGDGQKVLVLCGGAEEGEVPRGFEQEESLSLIDPATGSATTYVLGNPFTALAQSPGGRWAVAFFNTTVAGTNPNLLAVVDLRAPPGEGNPVVRDIRSLGSVPLAILFIEDLDLFVPAAGGGGAVVKKNVALVLSQSYVTLLDLDHPSRGEISVRLVVPGSGSGVDPTIGEVIVAGDPAGLGSRVFMRSAALADIVALTFVGVAPGGGGENDYRVSINQISVDVAHASAPGDIALFEEGGRQMILATDQVSGNVAVVDPETTTVTPITVDYPVRSIAIFDGGRSALLYAGGGEMGYFLRLADVTSMRERNLEEFAFGGALASFLPVPGRDFAAFTVAGYADRLYFLDLTEREMAVVYLAGSAAGAGFLIYPDGSRMIINPGGKSEVWYIGDMENYTVSRVIVDAPVQRAWLLPGAGRVVLDHDRPEGYLTFLDMENPRRGAGAGDGRGAVSVRGFVLEDLLSIDGDDYPMAGQ